MQALFTGIFGRFNDTTPARNSFYTDIGGRMHLEEVPQGTVYPNATYGLVHNSNDWTFTDDFEGVRDNTFWEDSTSTTYGAAATQDAGYTGGKVMSFLYEANGAQFPDSWSEQRMRFPACVQLEMSYKIFVPE